MVKSSLRAEGLISIILILPLILFILLLWSIYRLIQFFIWKKKKLYLVNIEDMTPYEFENYIALLFQKMGYRTKTTRATRDFGIDVIAKNENEILAIQVKKYSNQPVGNKDIRMLLGAMQMKKVKATKSILITTSRFTKNAIEQAKGCPIELWDGMKLNRVIREYLEKT